MMKKSKGEEERDRQERECCSEVEKERGREGKREERE